MKHDMQEKIAQFSSKPLLTYIYIQQISGYFITNVWLWNSSLTKINLVIDVIISGFRYGNYYTPDLIMSSQLNIISFKSIKHPINLNIT